MCKTFHIRQKAILPRSDRLTPAFETWQKCVTYYSNMNDEPVLKRDGRLIRHTVFRESTGECRDCESAWEGPTSIGAASGHSMSSGHRTYATYSVAYEYVLNPNESDHQPYGRAKARIAELLAQGVDEADITLRKDGASTNHREPAEQ